MQRSWCFIVGLLFILHMEPLAAATQQEGQALKDAIAEINAGEMRHREGDPNARQALQRGTDTLTRLIAANTLDDIGLFNARLYRAIGAQTLNFSRQKEGLPIDMQAARQTLQDFEYVLQIAEQQGVDSAWISNIEYQTASGAFNHLRDRAVAYKYWKQCSEREHAGCMNVMAHALTTGTGEQAVDYRQALELHKKIYATGTRFTCAGAFSSSTIADMGYFLTIAGPGDNPVEWIQKGIVLIDQIAERTNGQDPCGRSLFQITEYLFRLSAGDRQDIILRSILRRRESPNIRAVAQYMLGEIQADAAMSTVRGHPASSSRCLDHFHLMWFGQIKGDLALSDVHYKAMQAIGQDCETQLLYARKYYP